MAIRVIRKSPDPILRDKANTVKRFGQYLNRLLDDMANTMYEADGVGLAAPQIGISKRIVVVDVGEGLIELINPTIVEAEGEQTGFEGCLSVPDTLGRVRRSARVIVQGLNREEKEIRIEATSYLAIALQHEIDHLNGVLFIDRADELFDKEHFEEDDYE